MKLNLVSKITASQASSYDQELFKTDISSIDNSNIENRILTVPYIGNKSHLKKAIKKHIEPNSINNSNILEDNKLNQSCQQEIEPNYSLRLRENLMKLDKFQETLNNKMNNIKELKDINAAFQVKVNNSKVKAAMNTNELKKTKSRIAKFTKCIRLRNKEFEDLKLLLSSFKENSVFLKDLEKTNSNFIEDSMIENNINDPKYATASKTEIVL